MLVLTTRTMIVAATYNHPILHSDQAVAQQQPRQQLAGTCMLLPGTTKNRTMAAADLQQLRGHWLL
jgi:hypothetical protein